MVFKRPFIGDTWGKLGTCTVRSPGRQSSWHLYHSFPGKKRPFISDTGESPQETASSQYNSFGEKIVLKSLYIGDPGEALALHVHCSDLLLDKAFELYSWETELQVGTIILVVIGS